MYLGIEIGGTKLQLALGQGDGSPLIALERAEVDRQAGAAGIREQIETLGKLLIARRPVRGVGIGFGGPFDVASGRVVKSHHVSGWTNFPLQSWCEETLGVPTAVGNDCDVAALAEARFGAGRGRSPVFYVTVGTGIGGGLVVDGELYRGGSCAVAEIGHLRPGLHADRPEMTLESLAAGWAIAADVQSRLFDNVSTSVTPFLTTQVSKDQDLIRRKLAEAESREETDAADLLRRCHRDPDQITAKLVAEAAAGGNRLAQHVLDQAFQALGWAVAQVVTLIAPQAVVIGGGVSLLGEAFFEPVRQHAAKYTFPPLVGSYDILPARLGEEVVLHGALALARGSVK